LLSASPVSRRRRDRTRIQDRAAQANRSVQDELVELLAASLPPADDVPAEVNESLAALEFLDINNESVERAERSRLADETRRGAGSAASEAAA
jgi:plasmid stability protein